MFHNRDRIKKINNNSTKHPIAGNFWCRYIKEYRTPYNNDRGSSPAVEYLDILKKKTQGSFFFMLNVIKNDGKNDPRCKNRYGLPHIPDIWLINFLHPCTELRRGLPETRCNLDRGVRKIRDLRCLYCMNNFQHYLLAN